MKYKSYYDLWTTSCVSIVLKPFDVEHSRKYIEKYEQDLLYFPIRDRMYEVSLISRKLIDIGKKIDAIDTLMRNRLKKHALDKLFTFDIFNEIYLNNILVDYLIT